MATQTPTRPLGPLLTTPAPPFPAPAILTGRTCTLAPLAPPHFPALYAAICAPGHRHLWDYMLSGPFPSPADFEDTLRGFLASDQDSTQFYTILGPAPGDPAAPHTTPLGMLSLLAVLPAQRTCEIGNVIYGPALQRTVAATEAASLLLHRVFGLGYRRVVWKCNDLNEASKRAARRLGFKFEGVSRCHMVVKGRNRDTAWFAVVKGEWERVGGALRGWLGEGNFGEDGGQREKLEDVRRRLEG